MKQPITGVTPPDLAEAALMTVWPTIGATAAGRLVGRLSANATGVGFFTLGKLFALATIPLSLTIFCWQLLPYACRRYALTTRRIVIRKGLSAGEDRWISLEEFDTIAIEILPGQAWLHCGDVSFRHGGRELLRLAGVSRPEVFRRACLKAQKALMAVRQVVQQELAAARETAQP